ncbi:SDR family NAD(P)-dependent oxidoreductase [Actinoplanes sp. CA-142083]|uniref:SDR family NAD(P)-dependent oxidoreductase n=1 Tax=Actinoplanes sp. CA-142083 TaxID=3239903 RepID=UPI003D9488A5
MAHLRGKVVLIAGASTGIGREVALQAARRGASALVVSARSAERLETLAEQIRAVGARCCVTAVDATDAAAVEASLAAAEAEVGPIDVALLNIGAGPEYHLATATAEQITAAMRVNYDVTVNYLAPLTARMRGRGGLIAHTNSLAGLIGVPMQGPYSAAKAAVRILLDTYRTELRGSGIRFLAIYPGFVATDRTHDDGIPAPFEISTEECAARVIRAWNPAAVTSPSPGRPPP